MKDKPVELQRAVGPMVGRNQPPREAVAAEPHLRIVASQLLAGLLARIRDRRTPSTEFGRFVATVGYALILDACRGCVTSRVQVPGFDGNPIEVDHLSERISGVVILRAGLVFAAPFRELVPGGAIYQVGAHRDEATLVSSVYTENLPRDPDWADRVLLLDPMLATGGSVLVALALIRRSFTGPITIVSLVAAPVGVRAVLGADPDCEIVTATLDDHLDENGYIRPGLGDAGDRIFGTMP